MGNFRSHLAFLSFALLAFLPPDVSAAGRSADTFGIWREQPVYVKEFHIWWGFPYPDNRAAQSFLTGGYDADFAHMRSSLTSYLEPWRLQWDRNGYPMVGLYDGRNMEVFRWQLRCGKAAGITAMAISIFPDPATGVRYFLDDTDFFEDVLRVAAEEEYPVFFLDTVAFRRDPKTRDPANFARRLIRFLGKYKNHPGFYKVDGQPVAFFQSFGYWPGDDVMQSMMATVESDVGAVYWMLFGDPAHGGQVPQVDALAATSNLRRHDPATREWDPAAPGQDVHTVLKESHRLGKAMGPVIFPKFDGTSQPWRQNAVSLYGRNGQTLIDSAARVTKRAPDIDFVMLASWNDREEGSHIEPDWDADGYLGDPYAYLRSVAHLKGIDFTPPPPPPKEAVTPTIWEKLGYGDGAGPVIDRVRRTHVRGGSLEVVIRDTVHPVTALEVVREGDWFWKAAQPGRQRAEGNLELKSGRLRPAAPVQSALEHTVGNAAELQSANMQLLPVDTAPPLSSRPYIGSVFAVDFLDPLQGLQCKFQRRDPIEQVEPMGTTTDALFVHLEPHNKPLEFSGRLMNGWQCQIGRVYAPVRLRQAGVIARKRGIRLGQISFLGAPREERFCRTPPKILDRDGLVKKYYVPLNKRQLQSPGLHCVWLRGRDEGGNWGSPRLVAVPNFERRETPPVPPLSPEEERLQETALLTDFGISGTGWNTLRGGLKVARRERLNIGSNLFLSATLAVKPLPSLPDGPLELRITIRHEKYRKRQWVALFDTTLTKGWGVLWDGAAPDKADGQGRVSLVHFNLEDRVQWHSAPVKLAGPVHPGLPALRETEFELQWNGETVTLKTPAGNVLTAGQPAPAKPARLVLRGQRGYFDSAVVRKAR